MKTTLSLLVLLLTSAGFSQLPEPVKVNGLYGFSLNNRLVIPATFQYATHFREQRALVKQDNHWGFIDSTGTWVIRPVYDAAQPFTDGRSYVFLKGREGIIDPDGHYLLEPVYDSFVEEYYGTKVIVGNKKGYLSSGWEQAIPIEYVDFDFIGGYVSAQRGKEDYDLYRDGHLLFRGMQRKIEYADLQREMHQLIVTTGNKSGVLNDLGEWVIQPQYNQISLIYIGEPWNGYLYQLDATEYQAFGETGESFEQFGPTRIFLARMNGQLISETPFEAVTLVDNTGGGDQQIELVQNGKIARLLPDFTVELTPYISVIPYFNWKLCDDGEQTHILNERGREIAVFDAVEQPEIRYLVYDENGEPIGEFTDAEYLPYVYAKKRRGEDFDYAPYSLENEELMDTWSPVNKVVNSYYSANTSKVYGIYNPESGLSCYYYPGMAHPSLQDYTLIDLKMDRYLVANRANSEDQFLLAIDRTNGPQPLLQAPVVGLSTEFFTMIYSPEYPQEEGYEAEVSYLFERPFMYYKAGNGLFGLVTDADVVLPALYDTIVRNTSFDYMIDVARDGKWGSVDIRNGNTIAPAYAEPLTFQYEEYVGLTFVPLEGEPYYLHENGRKIYSLNPEGETFKEKGKYGLKVYSDFSDGTDEMPVVIPPVYKALRPTEYFGRYVAKNAEGKYGVLDQFNDTIIPFLYTSIEESAELMVTETPLFATTIGKKKGIADIYSGKQLPAVFDSYGFFQSAEMMSMSILVKSEGKVGMYSIDMQVVLPCEYDAIYVVSNQSDLLTYGSMELRACKAGKWHVLVFSEPGEITEAKLLKQPGFDLTIGNLGYIKTATGYDRYNATYGDLLGKDIPEQQLVEPGESTYRLVIREGKIGVVDENRKVVLKPTLTSVIGFDDDTLISVADGELTYFVLPLHKQYTANQW